MTIKQEIIDKAKPFIDKEHSTIDLDGFFNTNPYYRNKITYYFGGMTEFYEELGVVKQDFKYVTKMKDISQRRKTRSLRNELAFERLEQHRRAGETLEDIAREYGVSKQCVHQLVALLDTED
jgi:hypothetical protein